jgi:hypothetical protein
MRKAAKLVARFSGEEPGNTELFSRSILTVKNAAKSHGPHVIRYPTISKLNQSL